jgi:hypothetical protein
MESEAKPIFQISSDYISKMTKLRRLREDCYAVGSQRGEVKEKGQVTGNFDKLCIQFELLCKDNKSVKAH